MDIKVFFKMTKLNQLVYILLPIVMSYIYSLYQYDNINWGISFLIALSILLFILGINLMKEMTLYRHADGKREEMQTTVGKYNVNRSTLRYLILGFIGASIVLILLAGGLTNWLIVLMACVPALVGILYATGKKPLFATPLAELIVSFGCGFAVLMLMVYGNVYQEQSSIIAFLTEIFWVSLPFDFSFAMIQLAHNSVASQKQPNLTMAGVMGRHATNGVIEFAVILSFVLPSLSIYLKYAPGAMILIWLVFPKIWLDVKKFVRQKDQASELGEIQVSAEIIMIFQVLLYTLGIFF